MRAVYPIYATFFEKATEVGVILYEDTTTHEVGFIPNKLIEAYEKHNLEFDTSSSIVWFDNSQENLTVGDKVKLITRGATSQNRDTGHEMLNFVSVEKTE